MHQICRMLNISAERMQSQNAAVSRALKSLGFVGKRIVENGIRMRVYFTPETILVANHINKVQGAPRPKPPHVGLA